MMIYMIKKIDPFNSEAIAIAINFMVYVKEQK